MFRATPGRTSLLKPFSRHHKQISCEDTRTEAEPALVHVHGKGRDESEAEVVAQRPGVGVGAEVPADQRAIDGGVRQHRLGAGVEVVDVDRAAVLLQVQRPERAQTDFLSDILVLISNTAVILNCVVGFLLPALERLHFGGFWRFVGFDGEQLDGSIIRGHG